jgi:hypothetical protein
LRNEQSQLGTALAGGYVALVAFILLFSPEDFDIFWSSGVLLLTLPWSMSLLLFMWSLIHVGIKSVFLPFIVIFAVINASILYGLGAKYDQKRNRTYRRQVKD